MGLRIYVYRDAFGDCTNGGISSRANQLTLVNVSGPSEPDDTAPAAILESHVRGCLRIVPADTGGRWYMAGGNFGASHDSRFPEACARLLGHGFYGAVSIHDRTETVDAGGD